MVPDAITIDPARLAELDDFTLQGGSHSNFEDGACAMEFTKGLVSERNELKRQLRGEGADDLLDEQEYRAIDRAIPGAVSAPKEESPAAVPVDGVVVSRDDLATVMQVADYRMRFAGRWQSEQDAYDRLRASLVAADKGENDG